MALSSICIGQELPNETDLQSAHCITIVNQEIAAHSSGDATDQTTEQILIVNEVLDKAKYGLHRLFTGLPSAALTVSRHCKHSRGTAKSYRRYE
jgi:hypothetical protein